MDEARAYLHVEVPRELARKLKLRAIDHRKPVSVYVRELLQRELASEVKESAK